MTVRITSDYITLKNGCSRIFINITFFVRFGYEDNKRQNETSSVLQLLAKSTLLDPRFKASYLDTALLRVAEQQLVAEGEGIELKSTGTWYKISSC